jgi:hypothetical protein
MQCLKILSNYFTHQNILTCCRNCFLIVIGHQTFIGLAMRGYKYTTFLGLAHQSLQVSNLYGMRPWEFTSIKLLEDWPMRGYKCLLTKIIYELTTAINKLLHVTKFAEPRHKKFLLYCKKKAYKIGFIFCSHCCLIIGKNTKGL